MIAKALIIGNNNILLIHRFKEAKEAIKKLDKNL